MGLVERFRKAGAMATHQREVDLPDGWSQEQSDGSLRETYTFYATRLNYKGFERQIRDAAERLELDYDSQIGSGWINFDVVATVQGDPEAVRRFGRYATGLSAASDAGSAGAGI